MNADKKLFQILENKTKQKWKKFSKYYANDSKQFINKISRDYEETGKFPAHIVKQIKKIDKGKYDSGVCILRGGLPYAILFKAFGWKMHYVLCGRKNEKNDLTQSNLRFNKNVDKSLKSIQGKKILIIENNSPTGNTPTRVLEELKKSCKIKKPDLFLDYFLFSPKYPNRKSIPRWLKKPFWKNKKRLNQFGSIYQATKLKINKKEREKLIKELENKLK